ncbi:MAG: hypothetical protein LC779_01590 [Actinobacteria bacterium]|nr:hypothetical protein [Actinomycetota bacterium]
MTNATGFTAVCKTTKGNSGVALSWTISPDTFVDGYQIVRTSSTGAVVSLAQVARTTSSLSDSPPTGTVSYTYTIRSGSNTTAWVTPALAATTKPTYTALSCTNV